MCPLFPYVQSIPCTCPLIRPVPTLDEYPRRACVLSFKIFQVSTFCLISRGCGGFQQFPPLGYGLVVGLWLAFKRIRPLSLGLLMHSGFSRGDVLNLKTGPHKRTRRIQTAPEACLAGWHHPLLGHLTVRAEVPIRLRTGSSCKKKKRGGTTKGDTGSLDCSSYFDELHNSLSPRPKIHPLLQQQTYCKEHFLSGLGWGYYQKDWHARMLQKPLVFPIII